MRRTLLVLAFPLACAAPLASTAAEVSIALPEIEPAPALRPSPLVGYAVAQKKCAACHSADYIQFQPPGMSLAQWTGEMNKMQQAYGAPLSDAEVRQVAAYLAVTYGAARPDDPEVKSASEAR